MLTQEQIELYKDFCRSYNSLKKEDDFQRLSAYSFLSNKKVHILNYTREGIESYTIEDFNLKETYSSPRPLMDKEGQRLYS